VCTSSFFVVQGTIFGLIVKKHHLKTFRYSIWILIFIMSIIPLGGNFPFHNSVLCDPGERIDIVNVLTWCEQLQNSTSQYIF